MWFEDLTPYSYLGQPASSPRTLNVGWLERGRPFPSGAVSPAAAMRLLDLVELAPTNATRGLHFCDRCDGAAFGSSHPRGHAEIRVVGADGTRYAAPTLIHHYVTVHAYRPPPEFIDALMRVAGLAWTTARDADQCFACGSAMQRTRSDSAVRIREDGQRESVLSVWLACATCGSSYNRAWPA